MILILTWCHSNHVAAGPPPRVVSPPVPTSLHLIVRAHNAARQLASYGLNVFIHLRSRISADLDLGLHSQRVRDQEQSRTPAHCIKSNEF